MNATATNYVMMKHGRDKDAKALTVKNYGSVLVDSPCFALCEALNKLPGVATAYSCSGHGQAPFSIMLLAETPDRLRPLLRVLRRCTGACGYWRVELLLNPTHDRLSISLGRPRYRYQLVGSMGEAAYRDAEKLAAMLLRKRTVTA
jgi:hypothetical protein